MRVLHWFRNDLRLTDNVALSVASRSADQLLPLFVFDDALIAGQNRSKPRIRFLLDCLTRLAEDLHRRGSRLYVRRGDPRIVVPAFAREAGVELALWNRDYSPYAKRRDEAVETALARDGVRVLSCKDRVVFEGDEIRTASGGPYTVYTPYRRTWWKRFAAERPDAATPARIPPTTDDVDGGVMPTLRSLDADGDAASIPKGGESSAQRRLKRFLAGRVGEYHELRDFPAVDGTSRLSPYLRFGAVSIRACFREARKAIASDARVRPGVTKWLDELVWRDFYHVVLDVFPHVTSGAFRREYDAIDWENDESKFSAWCIGNTGYPFVDAAMRQLNESGWMHNRARMVVASFLTKDLLIDWRWGERYFMQQLVDGDPASNNGGWQWAASTGTDAQPYFRIFNPTSQGERFDPDGDYARRWVPELAAYRGKSAHRPWDAPLLAPNYPAPIVDHSVARVIALERYKAVRSRTVG